MPGLTLGPCVPRGMTHVSDDLPEPSVPALSGACSRNSWLAVQCHLTFNIGQRVCN